MKNNLFYKNTTKTLRVYKEKNTFKLWSYRTLIFMYNNKNKKLYLNKNCFNYSATTSRHLANTLLRIIKTSFNYNELKKEYTKAIKNNKKTFILNNNKIYIYDREKLYNLLFNYYK